MIIYFLFLTALFLFSMLKKEKIGVTLAFFIAFVFVGLRYETGFDWPIYKEIFERITEDFSLDHIYFISTNYNQEIAFIFSLGLLSQVLPSYEYVQAIFTFLFLFSFIALSNSITNSKPTLALAIFYSFFIFAVGFSTVRQTLAISFFNLGLAFALKNKKPTAFFLFLLAVSMQISTSIYVFAYFLSNYFLRRIHFGPISYLFVSASLIFTMTTIIGLVAAFLPQLSEKFYYYQEYAFSSYFSITSISLLLFIFAIGFLATKKRLAIKGNFDFAHSEILGIISILSAFVVGSFFFSVLRDRLTYEIVLLWSIFLTTQKKSLKIFAAVVTVVIGLTYQSIVFLRDPYAIAFVPYQNWIALAISGSEGAGQYRSQLFLDIFRRINR